MYRFSIFLSRLFVVALALGCYVGTCLAVINDPKITDGNFTDSTNATNPVYVPICPADSYLAVCGSKRLGTYWLKGMKKTVNGTTITTPNYYGTSSSDAVHTENLRKFFAGTETIAYKDNNGTDKTANPEIYVPYRNQILSNFCTNEDGTELTFECAKCPNNAKVEASTVQKDNSSEKILWDTWDVHTIADCYIDEFADDTGTYVFVPDNAVVLSDTKKNCYYSTNVTGDAPVIE